MSFFIFDIYFLNQVNKKLIKLHKRIIFDNFRILNNLHNISLKFFNKFIFQIRKTYNKFKVYLFSFKEYVLVFFREYK